MNRNDIITWRQQVRRVMETGRGQMPTFAPDRFTWNPAID